MLVLLGARSYILTLNEPTKIFGLRMLTSAVATSLWPRVLSRCGGWLRKRGSVCQPGNKLFDLSSGQFKKAAPPLVLPRVEKLRAHPAREREGQRPKGRQDWMTARIDRQWPTVGVFDHRYVPD